MMIFQPFGLSNYNVTFRPVFEAGYGLVTFIVLIIDLFLLPFFLKDFFVPQKWTVLRQISWQIWILFSIGLGNFIYSSSFLHYVNQFNALLIFQFYTLVVGTIPILVITILHQNSLLSQNLKLAREMNSDLDSSNKIFSINEMIRIVSENSKDKLEVPVSDFIYLGSTGNYIPGDYSTEGKTDSSSTAQ